MGLSGLRRSQHGRDRAVLPGPEAVIPEIGCHASQLAVQPREHWHEGCPLPAAHGLSGGRGKEFFWIQDVRGPVREVIPPPHPGRQTRGGGVCAPCNGGYTSKGAAL